jgi:hypothetical protein
MHINLPSSAVYDNLYLSSFVKLPPMPSPYRFQLLTK